MSPRPDELNAIIWRWVREVVVTFLVGCAGWGLSGYLFIPVLAGTEAWPLWLRVPLGLGGPVLAGVGTGVLWWRYGRRAVARAASFLGVPDDNLLSRTPGPLGCFFLVFLGMTVIGLLPIAHGWREFTHHRWLGSFRPADATVTGTRIDEVERGGLKGLAPRVLYEYRVNGERHVGHKIHWELQMPDPPRLPGHPPRTA